MDLDHTILDTDLFFHVRLRDLAIKELGVDGKIWERAYENVFPTGYTMEKHFSEICRLSGSKQVSLSRAQRLLKKNFSDLSSFVFFDVIPFVEEMRACGIAFYILSFGAAEWQKYKITAGGLGGYFDGIILTSKEGNKAEPIKDIVARHNKVFVIDNSPKELDVIKDVFPEITTFQINRAPELRLGAGDLENGFRWLEARRYLKYPAKYKHCQIKTLSEIKDKIISL